MSRVVPQLAFFGSSDTIEGWPIPELPPSHLKMQRALYLATEKARIFETFPWMMDGGVADWRYIGLFPSKSSLKRFCKSPEFRSVTLPPSRHAKRLRYIPPLAKEDAELVREAAEKFLERTAIVVGAP